MKDMVNALSIEKEISENNYKLLCQITITDDDYLKLINYTKIKVCSMYMATIPRIDLMLSLALVQIAIRHYQEGKYWRCFQDEIGEVVSSSKLNYVGQIFAKTLRYYDLFELQREDNSSQMYVENIKAHAFVTNYYMQGFFDFSYAFFENNLFRELSEDLGEDLMELSAFMDTTLSLNKDAISVDGDTKKAAKSYKLLKSTRAVFAKCNLQSIYNLFYPILYLIDKYYYEDEVPSLPKDRFEKEFIEWCKNRQIVGKEKHSYTEARRRKYAHKPFIKMDVEDEHARLILPSQKFRNEECDGNVQVIITINGHREVRNLEVYKSFGIYISEEFMLPIPDIFDEIDVVIKALIDRKFRFVENNYRIFNDSWESIEKFSRGHNYILVKKGIDVAWEHPEDLIDSTDAHSLWQYFSMNITEDSICYVGTKPLSIIGEFSLEPIFDELISEFSVLNSDEKKLTVTRTHPGISFVVEKTRLSGTTLSINSNRLSIRDIRDKSMYEWPEDKEKMAVNIMLDSVLKQEDGYYSIWLDIPGETKRRVCEYLVLRQFNCKFNKEKYIYDEKGYITIKKAGHTVYFVDEDWKHAFENDDVALFEFPITEDSQYAEFILSIDNATYTIRMILKIFKYGFSPSNMISVRPDYLWYADLGESLYLSIPDATNVCAYWGKEKKNRYFAELLDGDIFRIDISELVRRVRQEYKCRWQYINLLYEEGRYHQLPLPAILRNVIVDPYFKFEKIRNKLGMNINIKGNAILYLDIKDYHTQATIISGKMLEQGENIFDELDVDGFYNLIPYMEETDDFGFDTERTMLKPMIGIGCIDMNNLVKCRLQIKDIIYDEEILPFEYRYLVETTEKIEDDVYVGGIFRVQLENGRENWSTKRIFGKVKVNIYQKDEDVKLAMLMYSKDEDDWLPLYYDSARKFILGCDNKLLDTLTDYDRFIPLYEDLTEYIIDTEKLRRVH